MKVLDHHSLSRGDSGLPHTEMRILRSSQVQDLTGLKRSHMYAMAKAGTFPSQIKLGSKAAGWLKPEVMDWISSRVNASRQAA